MHVVLALAVLLQDKSAEETFKKIEEAILNAKAMSVKFRCEVVNTTKLGQKQEYKFAGNLLLKEADKLNLTLKDLVAGKLGRTEVSDGDRKKTFWDNGVVGGPGGDVKGTFSAHASDLAHIGVFRMLDLLDYRLEKKPEDNRFRLYEFAWGDSEKESKTLSYKAKFPGMEVTGQVKLTYDPKTYRIFKRAVTFETVPLGTNTVVTDTYEEFTLNADIPDEKFKLPEK